MNTNKILSFAEENNYDNVIYAGKWCGYDVYEPLNNPPPGYSKYTPFYTGLPYMILVKGETIRMTTADESLLCLREMVLDDKYKVYLDEHEKGYLALVQSQIESGEVIIYDTPTVPT